MKLFRVVAVSGARQVGKTTLLRNDPGLRDSTFLSFDEPDVVQRAVESPIDFLESFETPVVLDEYQRAGSDIVLAVKYLVDRCDDRGQFVIAGSTNFLRNRQLDDTLAGRVGIVDLEPLSVGEQLGRVETLLDDIFANGTSAVSDRTSEPLNRTRLLEYVAKGGYPDAVDLADEDRRRYFDNYLRTVVGREALDDIGAAQTRGDLRHVIALCAGRTGRELNLTEFGADGGFSRHAASGYLEMLRTLGLIRLLPAWSTNSTTRAKRAPKLVMNDSALAATAAGVTASRLADPLEHLTGALVETFVINELLKAGAWCSQPPSFSHFQDRRGREIDLIVERPDGAILAVEIKTSSRVSPKAFASIEYLQQAIGDRFLGGIVLHGGATTWRHRDDMWAAPISVLWSESP